MRIAELSDEEVRKIVDSRDSGEDPTLTYEDYSLEVAKLNQIIDTLNKLCMVVKSIAGAKGKDLEWKPTPRPQSAYERMLEEKIYEFERQENMDLMRDIGF